jgi:hypothetical protein
MDKNLAVAIVFSVVSLSAMVVGVVHIVYQNSRPRSSGLGESSELGEMNERMARIEQAVEAISMEVERIGEGQRFTTRLLAERGDAVAVPREPR